MLFVSQPVVARTQRRLPARLSGRRACPDSLLKSDLFSTLARDCNSRHSSSSGSTTEDPTDLPDCDASSVAARHLHADTHLSTISVTRSGRATFLAPLG